MQEVVVNYQILMDTWEVFSVMGLSYYSGIAPVLLVVTVVMFAMVEGDMQQFIVKVITK